MIILVRCSLSPLVPKEPPLVDLSQGYAEDGFSYRDTLFGITTIQLPSYCYRLTDETVWVFAADNKIDLGGGTDKVIFYNSNSTDYSFSKKGETINVESRITGSRKLLTQNL